VVSVDNDVERKKTSFELPKSLLQELAKRALEMEKSQRYIVARSIVSFLTSNVRADDVAKNLLFNFQLSSDPEDRVEIPLTVEQLKVLHGSVHIALRKVGENPNECKV